MPSDRPNVNQRTFDTSQKFTRWSREPGSSRADTSARLRRGITQRSASQRVSSPTRCISFSPSNQRRITVTSVLFSSFRFTKDRSTLKLIGAPSPVTPLRLSASRTRESGPTTKGGPKNGLSPTDFLRAPPDLVAQTRAYLARRDAIALFADSGFGSADRSVYTRLN